MQIIRRDYPWLTMVYPWIIWVIAAGFFFYKYLIQVSTSVMTVDLMKVFQVNGAGLGNLSAFYFYAYLFMQIPVGVILDRYSPRLVTSVAIFICSISTFAFSQTNTLWLGCIARAMMGVGAAFAAVSCFKLASQWFAPKRFALVSGMFMTAAMLGAVGGQMPLFKLVQSVGWRMALEIISVVGIALGSLYFLVVRNKKIDITQNVQKSDKTIQGFMRIMINKQTWLLSLYSGLAFVPVSVFGGLWGVPFLEVAYHFPREDAALATSSIFIGFAAGAPCLGWLSDYLGRRKPLLFLGVFLALICLSIVIYGQTLGLMTVISLLFCFGFFVSAFFTSFAMIRELFPIMLAATVLGVMNTFNSLCEALYEPLVGALLDWSWSGEIVNGVHQFSIQGYQLALLLLPISLIVALITLFFIQETYCLSRDDISSIDLRHADKPRYVNQSLISKLRLSQRQREVVTANKY